MTRKERILRMLDRLGDDLTYEEVIYHVTVLRDVEISMEEFDRGEGIDHDELFAELLGEDAKNPNPVVPAGRGKPAKHSRAHRVRRAANSDKVHKASQEGSQPAKKVS